MEQVTPQGIVDSYKRQESKLPTNGVGRALLEAAEKMTTPSNEGEEERK